ncbi:multidrug efflux MFS transporter [Companilactobacillus nodensis]|uniref:Drug H(+) antiporter n=1 Tax=Companilactobacillus nodensis DSM 19682 = JCM 14932 = NBRC 107160 TaxID=1423775 RepID=A0A0R1K7Q3_9LACO|nr:multidrug efflux MFS transporter [Companilactobacillus nodensis]KRK79645.1 drug H(+) antiporter [Companilactobacillus nodensis DSM 19682 = JCM 14932 = NBRC 107160]
MTSNSPKVPGENSYWRRNLTVLWFSTFMTGIGFSMITPFLPLYINQLGNFTKNQLVIWNGIAFSSTFLVMAIVSPIWGKIADRRGRKLMLIRAALGMAIVISLQAFATAAWQIVVLRLLQGVFSGFVSNANTLIASTAPRAESGKALGTLNTGVISGTLLGPLVGGVIAQYFGYRIPFMLTGSLLFLAFILVTIFIKEDFTPIPKGEEETTKEIFHKLKNPNLILAMFVTTMIIQTSNNSINPIISLYVKQLMHGSDKITLVAGFVAAVPGIANIIAAPRFGALGDKIGTSKILIGGLIFAVLVYIPQAFVTNVWQLATLRFFVGISDACLVPQVQTLLAKYTDAKYTGRIFGYNQSFQSVGNVCGPLLGSFISSTLSYSAVFISTSCLAAVNLAWVSTHFKSKKGKKIKAS